MTVRGFVGVGLVALAGVAAHGAPGPTPLATATVEISPPEATLGDRLEASIAVDLPASAARPTLPLLSRWGAAEVIDSRPATPLRLADGATRHRWVVVLAVFEVGTVSLPPLALEGAGGEVVARTTPCRVEIRSVLPAEAEAVAPMPPAPPRPIPRGTSFWWTAASLVAASLVMATLLSRRSPEPPTPYAARRPLEALFAELSALEGVGATDVFTGSSLALRRFLADELGIPAPERTTSEIERELAAADPGARWAGAIVDTLRRCDAVKFARLPVDPAAAREHLETVRGVGRAVGQRRRPAEEAA